ncbi:MAG: DUF1513 domain-containing protein [Pseudomonadota bacterium]
MPLTRRELLTNMVTWPLTSAVAWSNTHSVNVAGAACCRLPNGKFAVGLITAEQRLAATVPLAERGHGLVFSPDGQTLVVLPRRPGRQLTIIDVARQTVARRVEAAGGRHFLGHGFFSADGDRFFATENDYDRPRSVLGVYAVAERFRRVAEVDTGGIGAHEAILLRDARTAVVAKGGIETHPDFPRMKLNLADMDASIAYIDIRSGQVVEQVDVQADWPALSLRHLAEASDGAVWIGAQHEQTGPAPLVFRHQRGQPLRPVLSAQDCLPLHGYVGSVAADAAAGRVLITSPRGNCLMVLDSATRALLTTQTRIDVCGAASMAQGFWVSAGTGTLGPADGTGVPLPVAWDNHLTSRSTAATG